MVSVWFRNFFEEREREGLLYVSQFAAAEIMDHVKLTAPRTKVQDKAYEGSIYTSISWRHILTSLCGASVMDKPPLAFKHIMRDIIVRSR